MRTKTYRFDSYTSNDALVTSRELIDLAARRRMPGTVAEALAELLRSRGVLSEVGLAKNREAAAEGPTDGVGSAMASARHAISGVATVLRGHTHLAAGDPVGDKARWVYGQVCPNDTTFLSGSAADIDVEGSRLYDRAREKPVAKALGELGCAPHIRAVGRSLVRLAAAVKTDKRAVAVTAEISGLEALQAVVTAMRDYASIVEAAAAVEGSTVDRELLAPLANRRASRRARRAAEPATPVAEVTEEVPPSRAA